MNAFKFRIPFLLFLSAFWLSVVDLGFQSCQAIGFSITVPKRKLLFKKIFNSDRKPVAGEFILRKRSSNGKPGEQISLLVPVKGENPRQGLKSCKPIRINNSLYSSKLTPVNQGNFWKIDFQELQKLPPSRKPEQKLRPQIKKAQNLSNFKKSFPIHKTLKLSSRPTHQIHPSRLIPPTFTGSSSQDPASHHLYYLGYSSRIVPAPLPPSSKSK